MNNKALGALVAVAGVALALVGYYLWFNLGFGSKKLDLSLALGAILAITGIVMLVMPSSKKVV